MLQILHYEGIERDRSEFVLEGGSIHVDGEGCASLIRSAPGRQLLLRRHPLARVQPDCLLLSIWTGR
jgi:agmatine/peptidylarginine deiminase